MNILENIRNALGAIASNKMRSALTMLGVIIGVASVVLMVAIGQGAQQSVTDRIQSLGSNLLTITAGSPGQTNVRFGGGGQGGGGDAGGASITNEDMNAVMDYAEGIKGIAPELRSTMQAIVGNNNMSASITGTSADYPEVRNATLAYGSFLTEEHILNKEKVAVLGSEVVSTLFPGGNPVGQDIRFENHIFTVIGVMESQGQQGFTNQDNIVLIPITTLQDRIMGSDSVGTLYVSVENEEEMDSAQQVITAVLRNTHEISDPADDDFSVSNQADTVETLNEVTGIFTLLLGGIAAISLFVGGIGVMNIMLVSVTERTREIGIRKAIGAKKRDVLLQFMVEAVVLSVMGGLIGILISALGAWAISSFSSLTAVISFGSVALAFLFSIGVGMFFGILPAYKAAQLRPIQALRYE